MRYDWIYRYPCDKIFRVGYIMVYLTAPYNCALVWLVCVFQVMLSLFVLICFFKSLILNTALSCRFKLMVITGLNEKGNTGKVPFLKHCLFVFT